MSSALHPLRERVLPFSPTSLHQELSSAMTGVVAGRVAGMPFSEERASTAGRHARSVASHEDEGRKVAAREVRPPSPLRPSAGF
jgi:hypothetical protein